MAGFDPTKLIEARATIEQANAGKINRNNLRVPFFGAAKAMLDGGPQLIPNLAQLRQAADVPVKIPVFNKIPAGSGTVRKCVGTGSGATAQVTPTWQTIAEEFGVKDLEFAANQVGKDLAMTYLVSQKAAAIYKRIDDLSQGFLDSQKATVNAGTYFPTTLAGAKRVPYAQREELFGGIEAELRDNMFTGVIDAVTSNNMRALYNRLNAQGAGNGENLQYQLQNFNPLFTTVPNNSGVFATAYAFEAGTVGAFPWLRSDFREGADDGTDVWTTFRLPAMPGMEQGLEVELKVARRCVDDAVRNVGYVFSLDIAFLGAYAETTGDTGIYKYELLQQA